MYTTKACHPTHHLHSEEHAAILDVLRGVTWILAGHLAREAWITETHETCPNTRRLVRELVEMGYPIISGPEGFHWTKDPKEIYAHIQSLRRRRDSLDARIDALTKHALGA